MKGIAGDRNAWKLFMDALCSTGSKRIWWWWWMINDKDKEEHTSQLSCEKRGIRCNATASAQTAQEFCDAVCSLEDFRTDYRKEVMLGQWSVCERKNCVVYVGMGLDFRQILYRHILWVKDRTAFCWVVLCCHQSDYCLIKRTPRQYNKVV